MSDSLAESLTTYETQLKQVEAALAVTIEPSERSSLIDLSNDLRELISLTKETISVSEINGASTSSSSSSSSNSSNNVDSEFALFMSEMEKEGVVTKKDGETDLNAEIKSLEGTKCRAPHKHQWGDVVYHNAMICSVSSNDAENKGDFEVKVFFTNPTHQEMLPCPYFLDMDCKFSDEKCKYSHGETVSFSALEDYIEPKFESLTIGSRVLAKKTDNLWYRAIVKRMDDEKCTVNFELNKKDAELQLHDVLPLEDGGDNSDSDGSDDEDNIVASEDVINMSLMNTPSEQALGDWEKHTKGIGSKLMQKMGYVTGTGLGPKADGRIEPVTAVILPAGKSLDHCMELREKCGGDKDLFSAERKLKRLQKKQEIKNQQIYERNQKRVDVFSLLNETILNQPQGENSISKREHREEIKKETSRNLNVASMKIEEDMRRVQRDVFKIKDSLSRHSDVRTQMNKNLRSQLANKQNELDSLQAKALNIKNEQSHRSDKRKLTVF